VKRERDEFLRSLALVRKPVQRELKPEFDRAANPQVLQRTGTEDSKAPEKRQTRKTCLHGLKEALQPLEQPKAAPAPVKPEFERKAAKPPIDLTDAFNREVEARRDREDRDRDPRPRLRSRPIRNSNKPNSGYDQHHGRRLQDGIRQRHSAGCAVRILRLHGRSRPSHAQARCRNPQRYLQHPSPTTGSNGKRRTTRQSRNNPTALKIRRTFFQ